MAGDSEASQLSIKRSPKTLDDPEMSPNKRPRTLNSPHSLSSKGKDKIKIDEFTIDSESNFCGICLSEDGKAIRGWIDSCDHYFCFICIMEWAKVESRCPMCKGRFGTIRRPAMDGVFVSERVVNVPVRDQVYLCFGNATVGPPDPYSQVQCTMCKSATDENLLLLCDLCDSASHTYCVGLGATVPEGDWFCHDCTLSRTEHAKSEIDTNFDSRSNFRNVHKIPQAEENVSIFDIIQETSTGRPTLVSSHPNQLSNRSFPPNGTDSGARTLRRCRNVHGRIRVLRENWNFFRSGSLSFTSGSGTSVGNSNKKRNVNAVLSDKLDQHHLPSCTSQRTEAQKGSSSDVLRGRSSYEIDKAWKMMDVAKSMVPARAKTTSVHQALKHPSSKLSTTKEQANISSNPLISNKASKHPSSKLCTPKEQANISSNPLISNSKEDGTKKVGIPRSEKHSRYSSSENGVEGHKSQILAKQKQRTVTMKRMETQEGKDRKEKSCRESKTKRDDDAKSEVQSLVKLNLKLLGGDKTLGVHTFKEVARLATHSILAACGLEHQKPGIRSFPSSVCYHTDQVQKLRMSTLMPNSCRECFYVFVKDVVNTIMLEKISSAERSY